MDDVCIKYILRDPNCGAVELCSKGLIAQYHSALCELSTQVGKPYIPGPVLLKKILIAPLSASFSERVASHRHSLK